MEMLQSHDDDYRDFLFNLIFKTNPASDEGEAVVDRLKEIYTAFRESRLVRNSTHPSGNYRFYCDNDRIDGSGRWKLREDPPLRWPRNYIPQTERPLFPDTAEGQYQEYVDPENQAFMGPTIGCLVNDNRPLRRVTFATSWDLSPVWVSHQGFPKQLIRATTTFCDVGLAPKTAGFMSIDSIMPRSNFNIIPDMINRLARSAGPMLHEFCHYPPFRLKDVASPNPQSGSARAYTWIDVLDIPGPFRSIENVNNVVFFAILARLRDRGWLLSREPQDIRTGRFYWAGL
ncbi:MAG: hypothetical protein Q9227_004281 [Pyrenula ochraceoflavens]